ncbi:WbqC family protein [Fodinibius saliphilus]|uniref:WbqC family protein n=1 Tax=Fodinibius saliphilus TaxID=1920650 RepID=UPI00110837A2|nr:WbqC family protein [Fodinibius saliphilus]
MILALLFPQFAPNLYDLSVMIQADRLILQDLERWSRKSRTHRAKIRVPNGTQWINIPIRTEDRKKAIKDVRMDHSEDWVTPLLRTIEYNYRNSIYYDFYEPEIKADFQSAYDYTSLLDFILFIQERLLSFMEVEIEYVLSSDLADYTSNPDELGRQLGVDTLLQEYDSRHYQRRAEDYNSTIDFEHPKYHQHFDGFEPWCSILDILFQFGPESFRITDQLKG